MKFKNLVCLLVFILAAVFATAGYSEETPQYVEGEAIVVVRGAQEQSETFSRKAASDAASFSGGSVIQLFRPVTAYAASETQNGSSRKMSAGGGRLAVAHLRAPEGMSTEEFIEKLRSDPDVVSAQPNYIMRSSAVSVRPLTADKPSGGTILNPGVSRWSEQWGPKAIRAPELWHAADTGDGSVVVAVIDSGVMYDHPALAPNMYTFDEATADALTSANPGMFTDEVPLGGSHGGWFHSKHSVTSSAAIEGIPDGPKPADLEGDEDEYWMIDNGTYDEMSRIGDISGHGTHVAGIIGAYADAATGEGTGDVVGVCWNVKILPVNVFSMTMMGARAITSDVLRGIDFVLAVKEAGVNIRAVNMSLGDWYRPEDAEMAPYGLKIKAMSDAGIVVCIAAGNESQDIDNTSDSYYAQRLPYPACFKYENTISVGALMKTDDGNILPDTPDNGGQGYSNYSSSGKWADIFAPGTDILSTCRKERLTSTTICDVSGYVSTHGTSMATPHVAGAAALFASLYPSKSATEIKEMILEGANPSVAKEGYSGYGMLDVYEAWRVGSPYEEAKPVTPVDIDGTIPLSADVALTGVALEPLSGDIQLYDDMAYLKSEIYEAAFENVTLNGAEPQEISALPIFRAEITEEYRNEKLPGAAVFMISGEAFGDGAALSDIGIYKVRPGGNGYICLPYVRAGEIPEDGTFEVYEEDWGTFSGTFSASKNYLLALFIGDNGKYDLDKTQHRILDPTAIVDFRGQERHGSGGGCSAGWGALALLALLPLAAKRRR